MATPTKSVQVLFSEEEWQKLQRIARRRENSVDHLIREAVAQTYLTSTAALTQQERMATVEALVRMNLPVDDWEVMEREATDRSYFDEVDDAEPPQDKPVASEPTS